MDIGIKTHEPAVWLMCLPLSYPCPSQFNLILTPVPHFRPFFQGNMRKGVLFYQVYGTTVFYQVYGILPAVRY